MDYYRKILRFAQAENFADSFPRTQEPLHRGTSDLCLEVPFHRAPSCGSWLSTTQPGSSNVLWFQVPNTDGAHKTCATDHECTSSSALVMAINLFFHPQRHQEPIFLVNLARLVHYNASKPSVRYCSDLKMKSSFVCQHTQDCWLRSSCGCISNVVQTKLFDGCFCSSQKVHKHSESS